MSGLADVLGAPRGPAGLMLECLGPSDLLALRTVCLELRALVGSAGCLPKAVAAWTNGRGPMRPAARILRRACREPPGRLRDWGLELAADAPLAALISPGGPLFGAACRRGHIDLVRWFWPRLARALPGDELFSVSVPALLAAAGRGRLDVVQLVCREVLAALAAAGRLPADNEAETLDGMTERACSGGYVALAEWLQAERRRHHLRHVAHQYGDKWLRAACFGGHLEAVRWVLHCGAPLSAPRVTDGLDNVCAAGRVDIAREFWDWLDPAARAAALAELRASDALGRACGRGLEATAHWLHDIGLAFAGTKRHAAIYAACRDGYLETARWAWSLAPAPGESRPRDARVLVNGGRCAFVVACEGGHLDVVGWLGTLLPPGHLLPPGGDLLAVARLGGLLALACRSTWMPRRGEMIAWIWSLGHSLEDLRGGRIFPANQSLFADACAAADDPAVSSWLWHCRDGDGRGLDRGDLRAGGGDPFVRACVAGCARVAAWLWELWGALEDAVGGRPSRLRHAALRALREASRRGSAPRWLAALVIGRVGRAAVIDPAGAEPPVDEGAESDDGAG